MSRQPKSVDTGPLSMGAASSALRNSDLSLLSASLPLDRADIVIIGNGIAGLTAALEARRLDPDKRIVMITDQLHPTINTPALKQFAMGKLRREQLLAHPAGTERAQRIHVINARVQAIHSNSKQVILSDGHGFGYDSLLIATGSAPAGLPANLPGRDFDGVLTLHRLADYLELRRRLNEVDKAVVVGGGPHAIETVMALLHYGIAVHWLIRSQTFLPRTLDRPASDMILERMRRAGVRVYTETEVLGIVGRVGAVASVVTSGYQMLPCQLVVACTGTTSVEMLAEHCDVPMRHQGGILVDDRLQTSVSNIYAAGDVAALKNPQTGIYAPRAQWHTAVLQGRTAAAMMTDHEELLSDFGVPWHATQLGGLSMLTVGSPLSWTEGTTILTDSSKGSYRRIAIIDDRLVGYLSIGTAQPDSMAIKRIIDEGLSIRDIKKALLKGDFDDRKYFSKQRTSAAQSMLRPKRIPVVHPLVRRLPKTGPLRSNFSTTPLSSTTKRAEEPLRNEDEEIELTTGNLVISPKEVIESTSVSLPSRTSGLSSGGLWSYSDKLRAARPAHESRRFRVPVLEHIHSSEQEDHDNDDD